MTPSVEFLSGKFLFPLLLITAFLSINNPAKGQVPEKKVLVMKIREEIDPRMSRYVELALKEAADINADYVIVDMDTYGGAVNSADEIRKMFLDFKKPLYVFINKNAASAGALISIACDSIYMAPGSNIGASTVVSQDGQPVPDKYQSYMRSMMRSTAQANGRDPKIAEQMVGIAVGPDSLTVGKVLSFSTDEAIAHGYCEGKVNSIEGILMENNIKHYDLTTYELSGTEKVIAFFLNPYLRSLLIMLILAGIYFELQSPGAVFPIAAAGLAAVLYFVPSYLNGLAENWEILIFIVGIVLIAAEIFIIPGFGVAGIAGITLSLLSLILVMLNNDFFDFTFVAPESVTEAIIVLIIALSGGVILLFVGGPKLLESGYFKKITLQEQLTSAQGYTSNFNKEPMKGKTGKAYTVLRPSGKIMIDGEIYDAYTRGDYIEKDTEVTVIEEVGTTLKVKVKNA